MTRITTRGEEDEILVPLPPKRVLGLTLVADQPNWRKWWSMRWMGVSAALQAASQVLEEMVAPARAGWSLIPGEWLTGIPLWVPGSLGWAAIAALAAAGMARVVQQRSLRK